MSSVLLNPKAGAAAMQGTAEAIKQNPKATAGIFAGVTFVFLLLTFSLVAATLDFVMRRNRNIPEDNFGDKDMRGHMAKNIRKIMKKLEIPDADIHGNEIATEETTTT